jgi:glycerophosphoryl diester phosphodiesterase
VGADGVELDVHLSADGVPVVIHDDRLDATTDGSGPVAALTLADLKRVDAGIRFGPNFTEERIPTLEEALTCFSREMLVNIELKDQGARTGLEQAVVDVVRSTGMVGRVWFSSFKPIMLYRVRELAPEIPCGFLYAPPGLGSLLLAPITPFEALHPHMLLASEWSVRMAHGRGLKVAVWTVNRGDQAAQLAANGVDALISDAPGELAKAIA